MIKKILFGFALFCAHQGFAQETAIWLRYSAISPDGQRIAFTYKGDIYTVPVSGGKAQPVTNHEAQDFMPVWSSDGKKIAFASNRFGNFDVFIVNAEGGLPTRLTTHSSHEYPYSFMNGDKEVVFGANRMDNVNSRSFPTASQPELYAVSINGGRAIQILGTPAEDVNFDATGNLMIYHDKKGGENAWRKHQVSSIARDIWQYDFKANKHTKLTEFVGEDRTPIFTDNGKAFYYLSEESGSFNVHKKTIGTDKSTQITSFKKHPVRFLTASKNGVLCFSYNGDIYTFKNGKAEKVPVSIVYDNKSNEESIARVTSASGINVSQSGKEVAFVSRGDVFVTSMDNEFTKQITQTPYTESDVQISPDGKTVIYSVEKDGKWSIYQTTIRRKEEPFFFASTLLDSKPLFEDENNNILAKYSPDGKEIAYVQNNNAIIIYNIASKKSRTLLKGLPLSTWGERSQYFQWSPDAKWLLFNYAISGSGSSEVGLINTVAKDAKPVNLTQSGFDDNNAKWVLDGKAMIWFSNRDGLRGAAMAGGSQTDVYAMFFTKEGWDNFKLNKSEAGFLKELETVNKADTAKKDKPKKDSVVVIDLDGIEYRKARLTLHSAGLSDALLSKDAETLYYLARFEKGFNLWSVNLRTKETKMVAPLNASFASMQWDKDYKNIILNSAGAVMKVDPNSGKQDRVSIAADMVVNALAEREAQFEHVWRKTKNTFYTKGFHGADWDFYKKEYAKQLPGVGTDFEFSELLAEMLGELNVSHSGSSYFGQMPDADATASLGIIYDVAYKGNGIKVLEVLQNGPLDKSNINIPVNSIITQIDGVNIEADKDYAYYLNRKSGKNVLLTVSVNGKDEFYTIKPISLGEENGLLYRRWVKRNEQEVAKLSNGKLGYVHVPGMNDGVYRNVYEEVMGKFFEKGGLVVDTRFNGGGDLVADLDMFLSGKKFMDYGTDNRSNGTEPNFRWTKPSISLVNEANYSDGHCYAFMIQHQKINKIVGMPVPGTCTFAGWEGLGATNSIRWGVPPVGVKDTKGRYLENWQTEPDFKVVPTKEKIVTGVDEQLETSITELLKQLK
ncbi:S41 family peptidase [Polluticaenibacter yanchengensis]|uniref:Tricorn protease homolog n=1 Tax=Polluticaenibacter yanchengensis TaxID=3014562 RepID=A0ABT4UHV6_9BACT|nr:S41 family peptidase [Chitinophagaceae bacterium LY-5]